MRPLFDNQDFIEWIGRQKPDQRYFYNSCKYCLIARYLKFRGFTNVHVEESFVMLNRTTKPLPDFWNFVAVGKGHTFGQALERARTYLT